MILWLKKHPVLVALLVGVALLGGGLAWMIETPAGARWSLAALSRVTSLKISVGQVEGRWAGDLRLQDLTVRYPAGAVQSRSVHLRWRPLSLLVGRIRFELIALKALDIREKSPPRKKPPPAWNLTWPHLSGLPTLVRAQIDRLRATDVTFHPEKGRPVRIDRLQAGLSWSGGVLALRSLQVAGPRFRLQGKVAAGFVKPSVKGALALDLPRPSSVKHLSLTLSLAAPASAKPLSGTLQAEVVPLSAHLPRVHVTAVLQVERTALVVERFTLQAPGREATIAGRGTLELAGKTPSVHLRAKLRRLDLARETGVATDLSATLVLSGSLARYRGSFSLGNRGRGWKAFELSGPFAGDAEKLALSQLTGRWLKGRLRGTLDLGWAGKEVSAKGALRAEGLELAEVRPAWPGKINLALEGRYRRRGTLPPTAEVRGELLRSTLRGRSLRGELRAHLRKGDLAVDRAVLRGDGFAASAHGTLKGRLQLQAEVKNLAGLLPGAGGSLQASGWVRRSQGQWGGSLRGQGRRLSYRSLKIGELKLRAEGRFPAGSLSLDGEATTLRYGNIALERATLAAHGRVARHDIRFFAAGSQGELRGALAGGYRSGTWSGRVLQLSGHAVDAGTWRLLRPVAVAASLRRLRLSPASFRSGRGENLVLSADVALRTRLGSFRLAWQNLRLAPAGRWLPELTLAGRSSGHAEVHLLAGERLTVVAGLELSGTFSRAGLTVAISRAEASVTGGEKGFSASLAVDLADGGRLQGSCRGPGPLRLQVPQGGTVALSWTKVDAKTLRTFLPATLHLEGRLSGGLKGRLLPGHRLDLQGSADLAAGRLQWGSDGGKITAELRTASLRLFWRDEALGGTLHLVLADYGQLRGDFRVPLPARLPTVLQKSAPLHVDLTADMKEKGLLSALFPGLVRETRGRLQLHLRLAGSWKRPESSGRVDLTGGSAFFPAAGIRLQKVDLQGHFAGQRIEVDSFQAVSGSGRLQGSAVLRLDHWRLASYRGTVKGENFQTIDLPEIRVAISPELQIEGTAEKLKVRGEIRVPHLLVTGFQTRAPVQPSSDVVIVGQVGVQKKPLPMAVDLRIRVVLGKHVLVKAMGADARMEGEVAVTAKGVKDVTGQGEIKVAEGTFSSYGVRLKIVRGRILFAGGPVAQPTLDILATRTIQTPTTGTPVSAASALPSTQSAAVASTASGAQVTVGVHVTGTPANPSIALYSEPAMSDTDILSYIVLGHPLGADSGQANLLMLAAGGLLSQGQSTVLQDKIKSALGLSTLSIESGGGNVQQSMVTLGKYLTPELYLTFSQSLLSSTREVRLRYDFAKSWELESQVGDESGVDLYYKIEFK